MRVLGIIPARGGSKGIPGKNIRKLTGIPLLAYTAFAAKQSSLLHSVIVSSDDVNTIAVATQLGIDAPFVRPSDIATDVTPAINVMQHALKYFEQKRIFFDIVCLLQPTYPFRVTGLIDKCIHKFVSSKADTLFTAIPVPPHFNPHWVFEKQNNGCLKTAMGDKTIIPSRQLLPEAYVRDGGVYICKTEIVIQHNTLYGEKIFFIETDKHWYVNIDTEEDWEKAEQIAPDFLRQYPINN